MLSFVKMASEKKEKYEWLKKIIQEDYPVLTVSFVLGVIISSTAFRKVWTLWWVWNSGKYQIKS
ncbi:hypothetical protein FACS189426_08240 [Bacteroidia bacterium]|nr:hypothetical protein FACS189426_08240 [Bacteroidia bacterium]GHV71048.1 hypothetical protein FACS189420_4640 [Bacteroidia bacterium]